jgi:hypothetical protein
MTCGTSIDSRKQHSVSMPPSISTQFPPATAPSDTQNLDADFQSLVHGFARTCTCSFITPKHMKPHVMLMTTHRLETSIQQPTQV